MNKIPLLSKIRNVFVPDKRLLENFMNVNRDVKVKAGALVEPFAKEMYQIVEKRFPIEKPDFESVKELCAYVLIKLSDPDMTSIELVNTSRAIDDFTKEYNTYDLSVYGSSVRQPPITIASNQGRLMMSLYNRRKPTVNANQIDSEIRLDTIWYNFNRFMIGISPGDKALREALHATLLKMAKNPAAYGFTAGGKKKKSKKGPVKTDRLVTVAGRTRAVYVGAHGKQYVTVKGELVGLTALMRSAGFLPRTTGNA